VAVHDLIDFRLNKGLTSHAHGDLYLDIGVDVPYDLQLAASTIPSFVADDR
jgi:hypothetical protein